MEAKIRWLSIIRVAGILLIIIYHFFTDYLPGGFIGVDMFLTLSGFLMTARVMDMLRDRSGFGFIEFIKRRLKRLFPPLFLMVIFCLPLVMLIPPDFSAGIAAQTAAALGFATNYYEILTGGSYEAQLLPHLFVHTWFLAVEMQLFIIWALTLAGVYALSAKRNLNCKAVIVSLAAVFAVLSYIHMQVLYNAGVDDPSAAYFGTTSHAFPFFIGAIVGALTGLRVGEKGTVPHTPLATFARAYPPLVAKGVCGTVPGYSIFRIPSVYAVAVILAGFVALSVYMDFSDAAAYRYGILCSSLLTVGLILLLRRLHIIMPESTAEPKILTFSADMVYGIYLFHWPLYIIIDNLPIMQHIFYPASIYLLKKAIAAILTLALSLLMSVIVTRWGNFSLKKEDRRMPQMVLYIAVPVLAVLSLVTMVRAPAVSSLEEEIRLAQSYQEAVVEVQSMPTETSPQLTTPPHEITLPPETTPAPINTPIPTPTSSPTPTPTPRVITRELPMSEDEIPEDGIFIVGDSVILGAVRELYANIPGVTIDARGSLQMQGGYNSIMKLLDEGKLPKTLVVALGTNTNKNSEEYIDKIIDEIPEGSRLVFVVPYNGKNSPRSGTYRTAEYIRTLPELYDFVTIADWAAAVAENPKAVGADKIHIGGLPEGINLMVEEVVFALRTALAGQQKE